MNDNNEVVRHKAWRAIRARWRRGTGNPDQHQAAAIWVFDHRVHECHEAAAVIAELGTLHFGGRDMLRTLGENISEVPSGQRPALVHATLTLGSRTGRQGEAEAMAVDAIQREEDPALMRRMRRALLRFE